MDARLSGILSAGGGGGQIKTPSDYQDPHSTDYWPSAELENNTGGGEDFSAIKEYLSKFAIQDGDGYEYTYKGTIFSDGKVATTGRDFNGKDNDVIVNIYKKNGTLINSFSNSKTGWEAGSDIAVLQNGKIIVVGNSHDQDKSKLLLLSFNLDGSLDSDFGIDGEVLLSIGEVWDEAVGLKFKKMEKLL